MYRIISKIKPIVSLNLSNRYMSVKGTVGIIATVFTTGAFGFMMRKNHGRESLVCATAASVFWPIYLYLDSRDQGEGREHRKSFASSTSQNGNVTTFDDREASEIDKYEKMPSLQETINNTDENVVNLAGDMLIKGDTLVVFGQKGVGKSTLTMQIAYSIAKGEVCDILPSDDVTPLPPQIVLYYDNEMKPS